MNAADKIIHCCPYCGSDDIVIDATARWDIETQAWMLSGTQSMMTCEECCCDFEESNEVPA